MAITPAPSMLRDPGHLLSLGFGSGLSPVAPGTFGSVVGIGLYLLVAGLSLPIYLTLVLGLFVAGIPLCQRTATALKTHDHSGIVWDEIVGILVTLAFVPASFTAIFAGFLLFRLFDIWKPWPIKWLDRNISGGLGIMLDDLIAAGFAIVFLEIIKYLSYI